jgi:hypothetical protein
MSSVCVFGKGVHQIYDKEVGQLSSTLVDFKEIIKFMYSLIIGELILFIIG